VQQAETLRRAMLVTTADGTCLFDSVQATWNLLEQSAGQALLEARAAGMSVVVKEGMANGRLTARNTRPAFEARLQVGGGASALWRAAAAHPCWGVAGAG
jgi:aryl-alcohol dehydrogenase-like predicted oxidoreductase